MYENSLRIFNNGVWTRQTIKDLTYNQNVLFCSTIRPAEPLSFLYIEYLYSLEQTYPNLKVILVTTQPIQIASLDAYYNVNGSSLFKNITCILDDQYDFIKWLSQTMNKNKPNLWLTRFWLWHLLIKDNKIKSFIDQPSEDRKEIAKKSITKLQMQELVKYKKMKTLRDCLFLPEEILYEQTCLFEFNIDEQDLTVYKILFYHNLWPNTQLATFL